MSEREKATMNEAEHSKPSAAGRVREEARTMGEEVRKRAGEAAGAAQSEAMKRAEGAKASVADEMADVASALRTARDEMRDRSMAGKAFGWAAESLESTASAIRNREPEDLMNELGAFARRNPAMFLGGAALLGFAVSRFALSSARRSADTMGTGNHATAAQGGHYGGVGGRSHGSRPITPSSPAAAVAPGGTFQS